MVRSEARVYNSAEPLLRQSLALTRAVAHRLLFMSANDETKHSASHLQRLSSAFANFRPVLIEPRGCRQASVALMLRERNLGLELFVIRRAENELDRWSGHMPLPGGGREPGDKSVYDTARREALEEIGIDLDEGRFLGRLDDVRPRTIQLVISKFVFHALR
jgi:NUDIX domain-containing protein